MAERADALAATFEQANNDLIATVESASDEPNYSWQESRRTFNCS